METIVDTRKKVFITGGTSGIGKELARLYLERGDLVGICGRDISRIEDQEFLSSKNLLTFSTDVTRPQELASAINSFAEKAGGLDILIANAGRSLGHKSRDPDFLKIRDLIEVNLMGFVNTIEPGLKIFYQQGHGQVVAISSVAGLIGLPGSTAYCGAKGAVRLMCESFNIDLNPKGIIFTCLCPGFIDTPLTQKNDHAMPFIMSVEKACAKMIKAIDKKRKFVVLPWQFAILMNLLARLPRFLYRWIMGVKFLDYRNKPNNYSERKN